MESLTPDPLSSSSLLLSETSAFLHHLESLTSSKKFLIAYSGGLDSHVLLHVMSQIPSIDVRAMHIHHGLLAEADSWVQHCENICNQLNVPLQTEFLGLHIKQGESLENLARTARYKALKNALQDNEVLVTAHHQSDQTETLLLQLFRGAGVNGLAAMPDSIDITQNKQKGGRCASTSSAELPSSTSLSKTTFIRPFLKESRQSLVNYAKAQQLTYINDPSNADTSFDRNFLRNDVLPLLRKRWQGIDTAISRSASIQAETKELLDELAQQDLEKIASTDELTIALKPLSLLSPSRQKLALRYWIQQRGFLPPSEKKLKHIFSDVIDAKEDAQPVVTWGVVGNDVDNGAELRRFNHKLYLMNALSKHDSSQIIVWDIKRLLKIKHLNLSLDFQSLNIESDLLKNENNTVTVRFRQGGEKLFIPQRGAHISLKNLLHEAQVPPWLRSRLPLVYIGDNLVKVIGI